MCLANNYYARHSPSFPSPPHVLTILSCTPQNAVKTQIWIAISVYLLVAILKKELKIDRSMGEILQILSITLFAKVSMNQVLTRFPLQLKDSQSCKQVILFEF